MKTPENGHLLSVHNLDVHYGVIQALDSVSLYIDRGEMVCLIGANGAGKSTLLKSIVNITPSSSGQIIFNGMDNTHKATHSFSKLGLALVPEGRGIFPTMTVRENLQMGAYHRSPDSGIEEDLQYVFNTFPRLAERHRQLAGTLSGGEQQMLAIGRALLSRPQLLLLDEPGMGLAPLMVQKILEVIKFINQKGIAILLVEQNAYAALHIANRGYVMEHGKITLEGSTENLLANSLIRSAYLGI